MGSTKMHIMGSYGVTEVIGLVTITMIATTAIGIIVFWGIPTMESQKVFVRVESALKQFKSLNNVIKRVSTQGVNKSEWVDFVTDAGQVNINDGERFILYYSLIDGFDFTVFDLGDNDDKRFSILLSEKLPTFDWRGGSIDVYYPYMDNPIPDNIVLSDDTINRQLIISPSNNDFSKAVKMEIKHDTNTVVGRIWLFDAGSISYDLATNVGTYKIVAENEATLNIQQGSGYIYQKPSIYNNSYSFVFRITTLQSVGPTGGAGMSKYEFQIKSNFSSVQENKVQIPRPLRIETYGDENAVDAWTDYFKSEFGFSGTNGKLSLDVPTDQEMDFTLVYSLCDVLLR